MKFHVRFAQSLYRYLARAFPGEFRLFYGEDLDGPGEDAIPEVLRRYGLPGLLRLMGNVVLRLAAVHLSEIRRDAIYACRVIVKSPGFALVAVVSLALGIGMCCAVMSEFEAIVGPPSGVMDPSALMTFQWSSVSYPYYEHFQSESNGIVAATAVLGPVPYSVSLNRDKNRPALRTHGHLVSPEYFATLGVTMFA